MVVFSTFLEINFTFARDFKFSRFFYSRDKFSDTQKTMLRRSYYKAKRASRTMYLYIPCFALIASFIGYHAWEWSKWMLVCKMWKTYCMSPIVIHNLIIPTIDFKHATHVHHLHISHFPSLSSDIAKFSNLKSFRCVHSYQQELNVLFVQSLTNLRELRLPPNRLVNLSPLHDMPLVVLHAGFVDSESTLGTLVSLQELRIRQFQRTYPKFSLKRLTLLRHLELPCEMMMTNWMSCDPPNNLITLWFYGYGLLSTQIIPIIQMNASTLRSLIIKNTNIVTSLSFLPDTLESLQLHACDWIKYRVNVQHLTRLVSLGLVGMDVQLLLVPPSLTRLQLTQCGHYDSNCYYLYPDVMYTISHLDLTSLHILDTYVDDLANNHVRQLHIQMTDSRMKKILQEWLVSFTHTRFPSLRLLGIDASTRVFMEQWLWQQEDVRFTPIEMDLHY